MDEKGQATPLAPAKGEDRAYAAKFTLADSHRYKVRLVDAEGRSSKVPAEVAVNVTRNKPAAVTMARPAATSGSRRSRSCRSRPRPPTTSASSATA